nr:MAG TPA: hypothetical protein [Caudoviricetes sp.]
MKLLSRTMKMVYLLKKSMIRLFKMRMMFIIRS